MFRILILLLVFSVIQINAFSQPASDYKGRTESPTGSILADEKVEYSYFDQHYSISTKAPRHRGQYFKVQLLVVKQFNAQDPDLQFVKKYGRLDSEYVFELDIYRLLISDFFNSDEADQALKKIKSSGFENAHIVRYIDGIRQY